MRRGRDDVCTRLYALRFGRIRAPEKLRNPRQQLTNKKHRGHGRAVAPTSYLGPVSALRAKCLAVTVRIDSDAGSITAGMARRGKMSCGSMPRAIMLVE